MTAPRTLTTRAITPENVVTMLNREIVPTIRQLLPGTAITGSRAGDPIGILTQVLTVLANAGIIVDRTTP